MSDFGGLRSLLHSESPSQETFDALITMCREADDPGEVERVWVPYALARVSEWDDRLRSFRVGGPGTFGARPPAWLALVSRLDLGSADQTDAFIEALVSSPVVRNLRAFTYTVSGSPEHLFRWIAGSEHLSGLESLCVWGARGPGVAAAMEAIGAMRLRSLNLHSCDVGHDGLVALSRCESPRLRSLRLSTCGLDDESVRVFARSLTACVTRRLELPNNDLGPAGFVEFGQQPGVMWRRITLMGNPIGDVGLRALVRSGRLDEIRTLRIAGCGLGDDALASLGEHGAFPELQKLDLARNRVTELGARALAEIDLPRLEVLDFQANAIGAPGVLALLRAPHMPMLSCLDLDENPCGDDVFDPPADRAGPNALEEFYLSGRGAGPRLVSGIATSRALGTVRTLRLHHDQPGVEGARALGLSPHVRSVEVLDLEGCDLGDDGLAALFPPGSGERFAQLEELDLSENDLTDASASVLAGAGLVRLRKITATHNLIGSGWLEALSERASSQSIERLWLSECAIGDSGLEALATSPHFANLFVLDVTGNEVTERGLAAIFGGQACEGLDSLYTSVDASDALLERFASSRRAASLKRLCMGQLTLCDETWRLLATTERLSGLVSMVFEDPGGDFVRVLTGLRAEGARLNPWTTRFETTRGGQGE